MYIKIIIKIILNMCGIFSIINNNISNEDVFKNAFNNGKKRGPEFSSINYADVNKKVIFGFHRLAINGYQDTLSDQPFYFRNCSLICNGEIYNYKELYEKCEFENISRSDCEIIIHLYKKYGIDKTIRMLDGVFAFSLYDALYISILYNFYIIIYISFFNL